MIDLQSLAKEIYDINKSKGFHDGPPRSWTEICMLIDSEIAGEAVEALRDKDHDVREIWYKDDGSYYTDQDSSLIEQCFVKYKPEGFVTEIADGVIRLLDGIAEHDIGDCPDDSCTDECNGNPFGDNVLIGAVRLLSCQTHDIERPDEDVSFKLECWYFIRWACQIIRYLGHDPETVIREKLNYNKTRAYRHGGKRL